MVSPLPINFWSIYIGWENSIGPEKWKLNFFNNKTYLWKLKRFKTKPMCTLVWVNAVYTLLLSTPLVIPRLVSCRFSCVFMRLSYLLVFMFTFSFVQGLIFFILRHCFWMRMAPFKSKAFYNACLNCFEVLLNHFLFVGGQC